MSEYLNIPEYQENDYNKVYAGTESQIMNEINNFQNPSLKASEMYYDQKKVIVKPQQFAKPKYIKEKEVYQVLKPVTKDVAQLPVKKKEKVRRAKVVVNKPIVVTGNDELNKILEKDYFLQQVEAPIPTNSVIQNLCKESVIGSNFYSSYEDPNQYQDYNQSNFDNKLLDNNIYESKIHPELIEYENSFQYQSHNQHKNQYDSVKSNNINYQTSNFNPNPNPSPSPYVIQEYQKAPQGKAKMIQSNNVKHDFQMSKASNVPHYQSTTNNYNYMNNNNNNISQMAIVHKLPSKNNKNINNNISYPVPQVKKVPYIDNQYHQSKIQMSKIPYVNVGMDPAQQSKKNYIQTYFHDDDIPTPIVCEGETIKESGIKKEKLEQNKNKEEPFSNISGVQFDESLNDTNTNANNKNNNANAPRQTNSVLAEIPVDKTQIMSQQPSIDMSAQNSKMFQKSQHQSTLIDPQQQSNESKIDGQSKIYQISPNFSKNPNNIMQSKASNQTYKQSKMPQQSINQPSLNQQSGLQNQIVNQSNIRVQKITKLPNTQKSNMTYQQPYQQSMNIAKPPVYNSEALKYNMIRNDNPIPEPKKVVKLTPNSSNVKQTTSNMQHFSHNSKLDNQSSIYQQSYKQSKENNINTNYMSPSLLGSNIQQSKINQSGSKESNSKNEKNNFREDRSSFPTKSFAGNNLMTSKVTPPTNPFGIDNNTINESELPLPEEEKMSDSDSQVE